MNADQNQTSMKSKLEALQCHFTWDINPGMSKLWRVSDKLKDIGTDEGNCWLGHIYNLQGYIHHKLGLNEDAKSFFSRAAEAFHKRKTASDDGPWLMVNYANQAWLHHHMEKEAESQSYLSKVDALMSKYPPPSQGELHPEVYAEKAWTLMKFSNKRQQETVRCFERAISMQPEMVEWQTSYVLALLSFSCFKYSNTGVKSDIMEKMRNTKKQDPENLYLAVHYLDQCARRREIKKERIESVARELAQKILENPVSSYSGMKALLMLYRENISADEAINLAEEALQKHPHEPYLKTCAALCYKWKILQVSNSQKPEKLEKSVIDRAISLHNEVISLYPNSSFVKKIDLANIYAKSAEQMYQEMLKSELEPADRQMLYNQYAKHSNRARNDSKTSIEYHMKAAEIPEKTFFRENSIEKLKKIKDINSSPMCRRIAELLQKL